VTALLLALALAEPQRTVVLDNASTTVTRLRFVKGAGETVHAHPFPLLIVQLTPGEVDLTVSDMRARGPRDAGLVTFVPADTPHAVVNAGDTPFEVIAIALKPSRPAAPSAPSTDAPPGITRTALLDNSDARVVRVRFAPGSREPVHAHPNDLLTIQLTPGSLEVQTGSARTTAARPVGFVEFLPRNLLHAYVSIDHQQFDILSVSIK
jgi:quercetin dioxygenase-like cupin family protein